MKVNKNSRRNFLKSATLGVTALTASGCNNSNLFSSKSGLCEIKADVVVDCTGDADIAYFAGAPTMTEKGKLSH